MATVGFKGVRGGIVLWRRRRRRQSQPQCERWPFRPTSTASSEWRSWSAGWRWAVAVDWWYHSPENRGDSTAITARSSRLRVATWPPSPKSRSWIGRSRRSLKTARCVHMSLLTTATERF